MGRLDSRSIIRGTICLAAMSFWGLWIIGQGRDAWILTPLIGALALLLLNARLLFDSSSGRICPNCEEDALSRRSILPFGYRYYVCKKCGIRGKRKPFEEWEDASGPADARHFAGAGLSNTVPIDPTGSHYEGALVGTHGSLLEQKRLRKVQADDRRGPDKAGPGDL